jgi:hypothetical protein
MNYSMLRNADVEVKPIVSNKGVVSAHIIVNNEFEHTFEPTSRISQSLSIARNSNEMRLATIQLQDRMNGGHFFFIDDILVDHRDGQYFGFQHTDASIEKLMEVIGFQENVSHLRRVGMRLNTTVSPIILSKQWSIENFQIDGYLQGGAFSSGINFGWSPFMNFVKGIFEIVRQICSNGMVGTSELINSKIPLMNRWEQHLDIANIQMQNLVQDKVATRLREMTHQRCNVNDLQLITKHARTRLDETVDINETKHLSNLISIINPIIHLSKYYKPNVFSDSNVAARLPGHLTEFDLWNVVTEMYTHTSEVENSSSGGLQRLANRMLFPNIDITKGNVIDIMPIASSFSDPDRAFFGVH